jgi:DNA-binding NtrC family response regulator
MNDKLFNILVLDDDPVYRNLLKSILKQKVNVFTAERPSVAFQILKNEPISIIICDFKLPEMDGLQVLEKTKTEYPEIEVIMISSTHDIDTVIGALRKGAADYFKKPFTAPEIWLSIERTRKFADLNNNLSQVKKENSLLKTEINRELGLSIIGESESIQTIKEQMKLVAETPDTSILIIGESGTGKELVARGIHNLSDRKNELFGAVNMSAVPETLFESEFFGHKKGSFTGAIGDKAGWFESANHGTLFFDEVGEMTMPLQVKLLRVLEDREFTKVGTQQSKAFDVRIIAATNKTIKELTSGEHVRLDLFHRLDTFIIELPPLRERKEDIPLLIEHFFAMLTKKLRRKIDGIHPNVISLLQNYSFPGNIRELKNLMERAIILCQNHQLTTKHFVSIFPETSEILPKEDHQEIFDLRELEKNTIEKALRKVDYNKAEAARLLNIEWNALNRRIQKYEIEFP